MELCSSLKVGTKVIVDVDAITRIIYKVPAEADDGGVRFGAASKVAAMVAVSGIIVRGEQHVAHCWHSWWITTDTTGVMHDVVIVAAVVMYQGVSNIATKGIASSIHMVDIAEFAVIKVKAGVNVDVFVEGNAYTV
jgi:hypothetical protein